MEPFLATDFTDVLTHLGVIHAAAAGRGADKKIGSENYSRLLARLGQAKVQCSNLGLRVAAARVTDLLTLLEAEQPTGKDASRYSMEIIEIIRCELKSTEFYKLTSGEVEFLDTVPLFGNDVSTHFTDTLDDIDEAGKCLAFGRSTACVFHLMRVMETAIKAVYKSLGIPSPKLSDSWGNMLRPMDEQLQAKSAAKIPLWATHASFFAEAVADLRAIKQAWRDTTMHVEKTYTPEQAKKIFEAVKGFMRHLATKLDQDGNLH